MGKSEKKHLKVQHMQLGIMKPSESEPSHLLFSYICYPTHIQDRRDKHALQIYPLHFNWNTPGNNTDTNSQSYPWTQKSSPHTEEILFSAEVCMDDMA